MQAFQTKFLPATNYRGSRIKATCDRGSIIISYPHELSGDAVHRLAVNQLIIRFKDEDLKKYGTLLDKNPWGCPYVSGGLPDGTMVHVYM